MAVAAASVGLHVALLAVVEISGLGRTPPATRATTAQARNRATPAPTPSCEADTLLATGARLVYCTMPHNQAETCSRAALDALENGLITCNAVAMSTEVELVTPERIAAIEAEPLLDLLDPKEQEAFENAQEQALTAKFEEEQKRLEKPPPTAQQVVEITRPTVETPPDKARFLSEFDSRTDKETVARGSKEEMVERPAQKELTPTPDPREASIAKIPDKPAPPSERPDAPEGPGKLAMRTPGSLEPGALAREDKTAGVANGTNTPATGQGIEQARGNSDSHEEAREATVGAGGGGGGRPLAPNLQPSQEFLERVAGGGSVDKLDGVEEGELTSLNSARWKYASFFNRMKRHVAQHWNPGEVYSRRDPDGSIYGARDRITYLQVSLNPKGEVVKIYVIKSSGVDFLDEEAERAFRAAQPFPNPPEGLVDQQSKLITFSFGFHFELGRPGAWKVFRYQ